MSDILGPDGFLTIPHGGGLAHKAEVVDMNRVYKAEARFCELQALTRAKAGELLRAFIEAWSDARLGLAKAQEQLNKAKRRLRQVEGVAVLDKAVRVLEEKKLISTRSPAGSEDLRKAVVATDPDVAAAAEAVEMLAAISDLLETKAEALKMAYFSVDRVLDPRERHVDVSGGAEVDPFKPTPNERRAEFIAQHQRPGDDGFGGAKL